MMPGKTAMDLTDRDDAGSDGGEDEPCREDGQPGSHREEMELRRQIQRQEEERQGLFPDQAGSGQGSTSHVKST
ncbi:hypothetical protein P7K49_008985 [Saguinus oedipus]|uniref:Uncharacterized protein n=1 Tax=Saguinus oedipus TaxID=9490 RepID=A0ABQ9VZA3_SAGOE|nr:hypothetical protein P7K49_008985 [Saguinus oedipus]